MTRSSPGVKRMAAILDFMAHHPSQSFALIDLVRALKLSRATCHALLTGLVEVNYLYRTSDKTYVLGSALVAIGQIAADHFSPLQVAQPELRRLADEYDVVCSAIFLEGECAVVRERAASLSHVGFTIPLGSRPRLRSPFSAAFFAWSPEKAKAWLAAEKPRPTPQQRKDMRSASEFARKHGFLVFLRRPDAPPLDTPAERMFGPESVTFPIDVAIDLEPTESYVVASITGPVFNRSSDVELVIAMIGINRPMTGAEILAAGANLRASCTRIGNFLIGRRPDT